MPNAISRAMFLALATAGCCVQAQPVLSGPDLNASRIVEALLPPVAQEPASTPAAAEEEEEGEFRTRSIRVLRDQPSSRVVQQASAVRPVRKPSAASLLITFVTNSAELTAQAKSSLDMVARALQDDRLGSFKFAIEGHADARGTAEENLQLSQARAQSVVQYLVSQHGIPRERLQPVGKGDTEPLNRQQVDAPENRRVTIVTAPR